MDVPWSLQSNARTKLLWTCTFSHLLFSCSSTNILTLLGYEFASVSVGSGYLVIRLLNLGIVDTRNSVFRLIWASDSRIATGLSHFRLHDEDVLNVVILISLFYLTLNQKGRRPKLPEKLETLTSETKEDESADKLCEEFDLTESDLDTMRFLINVFHRCTEESPLDRPNAGDLHEMILSRSKRKGKSPSGTWQSSSPLNGFEA